MVFPSTSEVESYKWAHQNTLLFLDLYKKYREQVGSLKIKNLKKMFEEIAKEIQSITKTNISGTNCENRWKVLERNYKKYLDNSKLTGRRRKMFDYADIMHGILGKKRNIHPVLLLSSNTIDVPEGSARDEIMETSMEAEPNTIEQVNEQVNSVTEIKQKAVAPEIKRKAKTVTSNVLRKNEKSRTLKSNLLREIRTDRKEYYKKRLEIEEKNHLERKRKNYLLEKHNILFETYLKKDTHTLKHSLDFNL